MDINATFFGQMITFALFVWFTMKFVWPVMEKILKERQDKIAQGLMAAERGHKELDIAQKSAIKKIREAREQASHIIELANKQAVVLLEEAKDQALKERERILQAGRNEIAQERRQTQATLKGEVVNLVVATTEKLLERTLNRADQEKLLELGKAQLHD